MGFNDINLQVSGPQQPASIYKTKVLKGQVPFATQVTEPNTKYVIKHNFVLDGDVTIPENCILEFDGGSISVGSGENMDTITGNNTIINAVGKAFFKNIIIAGTWNNDASYLSWFEDSDDYTNQIMYLSLLSKKIYLDKGGNIKGQILINKEIEIDGCDSVFNVYINDTDTTQSNYRTLYIDCHRNVNIHNINFEYKQVITSTSGKTYECLSVRNERLIGNQNTTLFNITIKDFNNADSNPCQFCAIMLQNFDEGNTCYIHDIIVNNCINLGDGTAVTGSGGIYAIRVQVSSDAKATGVGDISNISVNTLANCKPSDHEDLRILEDCAAIYICAVPGVHGMNTKININLHDFYFVDVAERCFKLQGEDVVIKNVHNIFTTKTVGGQEVSTVLQSQIVDMQGNILYVENVYGETIGNIVRANKRCIVSKCTLTSLSSNILVEGSNIIIEDSVITKTDNLRCLFYAGDGNHDFSIKNSKIILSSGVGSLYAHPSSVSAYQNVTINIIDSYLEGFNNLAENSSYCITKLIVNNSYLGISNFGYMLQNFDIENSKVTCLPEVYPSKDSSIQIFRASNSEFVFDYPANYTLNFLNNSKVKFRNVLFTNLDANYRNLTLSCPNGVIEAIFEDVKYNKVYLNVERLFYKFSTGAGNITFKKNTAVLASGFSLTEDSSPTNPLSICYNSQLNPDAAIIPYIINTTRILNVSDLNFVGKDGVTYCYNNKNVYYRGGQWIDATGTPV